MTIITPEIVEDVLRNYKQTRRSPFRTAQACGIDVSLVFEILESNKDRMDAAEERHGGMGRPELQGFIVARRKVTVASWDNASPEIAAARSNYEAGTHELATGRDGKWLILYAIPRRRVQARPSYFALESC